MLQMLYDKWWKEYGGAGKCDTGDDKVRKDANALTIANVGGVFVVLIVGLLLSPVVAAFEFVWNARKRRRKRAHSQSHDRAVFAIYLVSLDQELISYHYLSSASSCSSCWSYTSSTLGSVVSNRIGMKFGGTVLQVGTHRRSRICDVT